ncbi:FkbM family methyltransferase [Agrobacterium radiobacter]|uniref:FkbM family methyltransferase n=1 Tax=Agrobacterium radiobacter TaxID=362 RepID=UPI003F840070
MVNHQVFNSFRNCEEPANEQFWFDYIGTRIDRSFHSVKFDMTGVTKVPIPIIDEEYFEWVDILQSASEAKGRFVVVELGAGYGRWAARACLAARQRGVADINAILVEAEPVHAEWSAQHMRNNGIDNFRVFQAAIGPSVGKTQFVVEMPDQNAASAPDAWYGQALNWTDESHHRPTGRTYQGFDVIDNGTGWGTINVNVLPLEQIINGIDLVDIIDMDIQGAEGDVVEASIDLMSDRVKRVHIGTHSHEVEDRIRKVMTEAGWHKVWDFSCGATSITPYGAVAFQDGVQSWLNPRL